LLQLHVNVFHIAKMHPEPQGFKPHVKNIYIRRRPVRAGRAAGARLTPPARLGQDARHE
jgi:hypothetical protein